MFYSKVNPFIVQSFCQRRLKYESLDPNSKSSNYSLICLNQDLTLVPTYFKNFGSNSKLQFLLNPQYQTVIYDSAYNLSRNEIVTIQQIETDYLKNQSQASYFISMINQNNKFVLNSTNQFDIVGFNYENYQQIFEYERNSTECIVLQNQITIIDKVPKFETLKLVDPSPKYQIKNAFLFLNILSKEKMLQYCSILQQQIQQYNFLFMLISLVWMISILFVQIIYSFLLSQQTLKPIIHLTSILKQLIDQDGNGLNQNFLQSFEILKVEDISDNINKIQGKSELSAGEYFKINQSKQCFSSDTKELFDSFKNLFKVLVFTTQNIYKENESTSLINLSIEVQHFNQFKNHRAIGVCYNNIGVIHYNGGRYKESIENLQRSIISAKYELGFYKNSFQDHYLYVDNEASQFSQVYQNLLNQNNYELSVKRFEDGSKLLKENDKSENGKILIFWSLYNRTINLIKALFSYITENNLIDLSDMLEDIILDVEKVSQIYLNPCQKREILICYMKCLTYKLQNNQKGYFDVLEKCKELYINHRKTKKFNCTANQTEQNNILNQAEEEINFFYQNGYHTLLSSPMSNKKQIKRSNLFKKYKLSQYQLQEPAQKDQLTINPKSLFQNSSLKRLKRYTLISDNQKSICYHLKQQLAKNKTHFKNYQPFFQVRKNLSQKKLCRYQFSSDILFQYFALEQVKFQIMLQNYFNAGFIITNLLEKCVYYLPFLKIKAYKLAADLFKLSNIQNPYLEEILNKYTQLAYANIKVCTISACQSKYSQFRSYALQSDLINDILFNDKDQFGLINYSFEENLYFQLIQWTNIQMIKSNQKFFQNIQFNWQKEQQSINSYSVLDLDKSSCKTKYNEKIISSRIKSKTLSTQNEPQFTPIYSYSKTIKTNLQLEEIKDRECSPIEQQAKTDKLNTFFQDFSHDKTHQFQMIDFRQASLQQSSFINQSKQDYSPNQFMKDYVLTPKISSFCKSPVESSDKLIKKEILFDLETKKRKKEAFYGKYLDSKCLLCVSKQTNGQFLNYCNYSCQTTKLSKQNILNFSSYIQDIEDTQKNQKENNQTINNDKICLSDVFDKEAIKSENAENNESKQNSFFLNTHQNKQKNHQNNKLTFLENLGLNQQQTTNFSFTDLKDEQKQSTPYSQCQGHKQEISAEWIFHQGVQAALKQFILNTDQKIQIYLSQKNYSKQMKQINKINGYHTYLLFITDTKLEITNQLLFQELTNLLANLNVELLVLFLNQNQATEEFSTHINVFIDQKSVVTFFTSEEKLLQYIYSQREHVKNYLFPMIFEHF
ncbi:YLP motif protein, putative (macronuclear) [Tetrahymena thermophila SB210]|uniref:YLP motif protein, putative n=1 Tax=Tetrahymena thermophila (strain SB210) TaxID=312017 RepID=Q22TX9_TETTS|nr:YLP motif protein, putative [Tetrahymena thermophila SB210]EAR88908.2 YLP motif protein, putative [Tetrahymena thermophila SB210]|eukprot:XP_001009153.2 YLP motif protein, putative [Tetrahymena thermophila SB210]